MMYRIKAFLIVLTVIIGSFYIQSFKDSGTAYTELKAKPGMLPKLSDYGIYEGNAYDLKPSDAYTPYVLATGLFTDYAEKQRLIKLPAGTKLTAINDGLPDFPDGTILVKTFYYSNSENLTLGKKIIETRILIKGGTEWIAGTYKWNNEQTDALLIEKGTNVPVTFIDNHGKERQISYHIPCNKDCRKCHGSKSDFAPIGIKIQNLNREINVDNVSINQLQYLKNKGLLECKKYSEYTRFPDWQDTSLPLEKRARAYLDINCAHCHREHGYCSHFNIMKLRLAYDMPLEETKIVKKADRLGKLMAKKKMPYLGTTIIDDEGLSLVKEYLKSLK
jgi:uncharacterized repeat protein (TIGR03806 family)